MRRIYYLLIICLFGITVQGCHKSQKVSYEKALGTLSDYEGAEYHLAKMEWGGESVICRTENKAIRSKDLVAQLRMLAEYSSIMGTYDRKQLSFSQALKDQEEDKWAGSIEILLGVQNYQTYFYDEPESPKPSEVAIPFVFSTFSLNIPYAVDMDGNISCEEYVAKKTYSRWDDVAHLDCRIESLTKDAIIILFPDYLVPDFYTDQFYTGPVTMEFVRN